MASPSSRSAEPHPFVTAPHRTMVVLSVPIMLSLVAEPLTALIDTAFVKELGARPVAALGVGAQVLGSAAWIFNFLSIGTQTQVARAAGAGQLERGRELCGLALLLSLLFGTTLVIAIGVGITPLVAWMGGRDELQHSAEVYLGIRLLGSPLVLVTATAFGALRGLQDMRTPLRIAVATHAINIALDPLLIFGLGPIPAMGLAGAAWASVASQWVGGVWAVVAVARRLGLPAHIRFADAPEILTVGRDLFLRTGLLMAFLLLTRRAATQAGADAAAAHHAVWQIWLLTALALDAFAAAAQSLVGYFLGAEQRARARHAASVSMRWGLGTGVALGVAMVATTSLVADALVPESESARALFASAWWIAALAQPLNALCFVTDGVHWGTTDYRYLRNGMLAATGLGVAALSLIDPRAPDALAQIWWVTSAWIAIRAGAGVARIWPGVGAAPLR